MENEMESGWVTAAEYDQASELMVRLRQQVQADVPPRPMDHRIAAELGADLDVHECVSCEAECGAEDLNEAGVCDTCVSKGFTEVPPQDDPCCPKCNARDFVLEEWGVARSNAKYVNGELKVSRGEADVDEVRLHCGACGHQLSWADPNEERLADAIHELFEQED
jgi:hypothetical protein